MLNATLKIQKGNRRSAICRMAFISPSYCAPTTTFPSHYDILLSFSRCSRSCLTRSSSRLYASTIRVTSLWRMISFCVISTKAMPSTPCNIRWASTRPLFATTASLSACGHPSRSFGIPAHTGQEHLYLCRGGVLRLVKYHHCIIKRAATHKGQRRYLNDIGVHVLLQFGCRNHLLQRVIQGLQVGVNLVLHVTRQETKFLTSLNSGTA